MGDDAFEDKFKEWYLTPVALILSVPIVFFLESKKEKIYIFETCRHEFLKSSSLFVIIVSSREANFFTRSPGFSGSPPRFSFFHGTRVQKRAEAES